MSAPHPSGMSALQAAVAAIPVREYRIIRLNGAGQWAIICLHTGQRLALLNGCADRDAAKAAWSQVLS